MSDSSNEGEFVALKNDADKPSSQVAISEPQELDKGEISDDESKNQEEDNHVSTDNVSGVFDDETDPSNNEGEPPQLDTTEESEEVGEANDIDGNVDQTNGSSVQEENDDSNVSVNVVADNSGKVNAEKSAEGDSLKFNVSGELSNPDNDDSKADDANVEENNGRNMSSSLMANIFDDEADGSDNDEDETSKLDATNRSKDADGDKKSDDEHANQEEDGGNMGNLMANIFGDDNDVDDDDDEDDSKEGNSKQVASDEDEPKFLRIENGSDDNDGREWDFDVMLRKKKATKKKRKTKGDSISLISDADDQVKALVDAMSEAANTDRQSNIDKRPAIQKRKMLPLVRQTLLKSDLFETLLDNGMMSAISEWLAPLPDKSLPALEVRTTLLKILQSYPGLEQGILKQSGLGKAVMFLFKHPKEIRENKTIAAKLIREWSRPIFQLDTDFRSLSRDERWQRDYQQLPPHKRQRLNLDDDGNPITPNQPSSSQSDADSQNAESGLRPGEAGFILRARVPRPSTKSYVVRPKPAVEGRFQGPSKNRTTDRFDKAQREFKDRNRSQKVRRSVVVSIEGRKMDI